MNVWIQKCRRPTTCKHCPTQILVGEYLVMCSWYKSRIGKDGSPQKWRFSTRFHPQCWIDYSIYRIEQNPVIETRGRKRLVMTDEDKSKRFAILRRRASTLQKIRNELSRPEEERSIDRVIYLGGKLNDLKEEIEPLGGAPSSWT